MFCCVDVDYQPAGVTAAAVGFTSWTDALAAVEVVVRSFDAPQPYEPGAFAKRELPFLQGVLARMPPLQAILVDAYVWLGPERPGLGMTIDIEAARRYLVPVEIRVGGELVYETPELRD